MWRLDWSENIQGKLDKLEINTDSFWGMLVIHSEYSVEWDLGQLAL